MSEWMREPHESGWYWYIDIDFMEPERVEVVNNSGEVSVIIDDDHHPLAKLEEDGAHFYGPIPEIETPVVPTEIRDYLEDLDKIRWGDDAFQDLDDFEDEFDDDDFVDLAKEGF